MALRHLFTSVLGCLLVVSTASSAAGGDPQIPEAVSQGITEIMQKRVSDLAKEKDAGGHAYKRGVYSKSFQRVDDSTYTVGMHVATAGPQQMKVERLMLTLTKGADGTWSITKEDVKDTYDKMWRTTVPEAPFYSFDSVAFEREGLKVTGGAGTLYKVQLSGSDVSYVASAANLAFEYAPPADVPGHMRVLHGVILKKFPDDFTFPIQEVSLSCSPQACKDLESALFRNLRPVAKAAALPHSKKSFDERNKEVEKNRTENYFSGFRTLSPPDRYVYTVAVERREGRDTWAALTYDSYEPWEISFATSEYGPVFGYYSEETRKSGKTPYELEQREDADARYYETESLTGTVELALQDAGRMAGDITVAVNVKRDMQEVPFFIARFTQGGEKKDVKDPRMFVNSVQDGDGNELTWVRTSPFSGFVVLPKPVPKGTKLKLRMQLEVQDSIYKLNNSYFAMSRGGWLPFVRFGDMIHQFELTVKVPSKYTVLGIGRKTSESKADGVTTTTWLGESPVNFPTVIFGDYLTDTPRKDLIAKRLDGSKIDVNIYVDKESTHALDSGAAADSGARDIRGSQLQAKADEAANALNLFSNIFGVDYPFHKLDLVNDPLGFLYGQSPSSIIYLGFAVFRSEAAFGHDASLSRFLKEVVPHEVGHQWWGAVVVNANSRNYWFVESLAEYSSALFVEAINSDPKKPDKARKAYLAKVADWRRNILESGMIGSVQNASALWSGNGFQSYQAAVYNQGPYAFHILRETFGDAKFFPFLKKLAQELKGKEIVTRDMQRVSEESFGIKMDWFWDQWIRGVGLPQFTFSYTARKTEDGNYLVEGKIRQRVVAGPDKTVLPGVFYNAMAKVVAIGSKGEYPKVVPIQGEETTFRFKVAEEPLDVVFNKNGEILAHDILVNRGF
jgi:hypothetical protein